MNKLLRQFIRLATATCSQCGDINPYLDSDDPKFLCRQCRTRAQAWGGDDDDDKKMNINQTVAKRGIKAFKAFALILLNQILSTNYHCRRYISMAQRPLRQMAIRNPKKAMLLSLLTILLEVKSRHGNCF